MKKSFMFVALFACAGIAMAQTGADGETRRVRGDHFAERDSNKDGKISLAEWQQADQVRQKKLFERIDADRNGLLTREEIQKRRGDRRQRMQERRGQRHERMRTLKELDKDGDKALTRAEIGDRLPKLGENFDRFDGNRDGKLTREEMRAGRSQMREASNAK